MIISSLIAIAIAGGAIESIRRWIWPFIAGLVAVIEAIPVLVDISQEFKPNGGSSLRDQIDEHSMLLRNIQQQLERYHIPEGQ